VAAYRGIGPFAAERSGNSFIVQTFRDNARTDPSGKLAKDTDNDFGMRGDDFAVAANGLASSIDVL